MPSNYKRLPFWQDVHKHLGHIHVPHINAWSWKLCKHFCLHRWMKVTKLCAKIKSSCRVYAKLFDPPKANSFYHIYFIVFCCSNLGQITRAFNHTINNGVTFLSFRAQYRVKNKAGLSTWTRQHYHSLKEQIGGKCRETISSIGL